MSSTSANLSPSLDIHYFCNSGYSPSQDVDDVEIFSIRQIEALPLTSDKLRTATRNDPVLGRVLRLTQQGWPNTCPSENLKPYYSRRTELSVIHGCILWGVRVLIPEKLQSRVFTSPPLVMAVTTLGKDTCGLCGSCKRTKFSDFS